MAEVDCLGGGQVGTAFNLVDSFASGVLGILCVGHSPHEAFRELATALDFISRQVGPRHVDDWFTAHGKGPPTRL